MKVSRPKAQELGKVRFWRDLLDAGELGRLRADLSERILALSVLVKKENEAIERRLRKEKAKQAKFERHMVRGGRTESQRRG